MLEPITADAVVEALIRVLPTLASAGTRDWTSALLGALAELGDHERYCVNPSLASLRARPGLDEFLWDLTISEWPRYGGEDPRFDPPDYYQRTRSPELVLVAESEWGKLHDSRATASAVLDDFAKLLAARCPLKVMIFSYHHAQSKARHSSYDELVRLMKQLIDRSRDDATYVLLGLAWDAAVPPGHQPIKYSRSMR